MSTENNSYRDGTEEPVRELGTTVITPAGLSHIPDDDQRHDPEARERIVPSDTQKKLGIALVGLGKYSTGQLAPALQETQLCCLSGIVTGSEEKASEWKLKYDLAERNIYSYADFDKIKENKDIDILYIAVPNGLHAEFVVKAAQAGKHVICEKPMATTLEDCDRMIEACNKAGVMLSIGYRLHFEPHHQEMIRLANEKVYGDLKSIRAEHGLAKAEGWRLDLKLAGGGPLMDVGIYCVQAARYVTGLEPIAVSAKEFPKKDPKKHKGIEESIRWQMEFPGGIIAECFSSYTERVTTFHAQCERGFFELEPAYSYSGIEGKTSDGKMDIPNVNQQARQMDDFAMAVTSKRDTPVSGEEGRKDVRILLAIYEAMKTGKRVEL